MQGAMGQKHRAQLVSVTLRLCRCLRVEMTTLLLSSYSGSASIGPSIAMKCLYFMPFVALKFENELMKQAV